ncbi:MAG: NAD(P)-dependent oxidoreductase [Candidatus Pedobacter colombiensis]|uniref:NAD(P)-dependent oxidoreductase n=1 Tax=Candidatus Pedobacter colombiensis TaxID=3121371 RepID=A0AAJ6B8L9_9SPHI|nr:NAD(P)-dependent oxidoreductase [Pedobacter sp.]WEK21510.1 MAG: NAD(P)-dependent oxidoreductase [Pedobacter sp.]
MSKKRVLITGASGFVGYHLIEEALKADLEVYAAIRPSSDRSHLKGFNVQYVNLDYSVVDSLKQELEDKQYHYIIHAAGITKAKTKAEYDLVNATYTRNLATAALEANINLEKFVFVSSLAALGPLKDLSNEIQDVSAPHPVTNYGASKMLAEQYLAELTTLPLLTIRPTAVYGPREKDLFILFNSINKGLEPHIGSFKQQLSFVYVKDLVNVIVKALTATTVHQHYNISDGETYDRYALATFTKKALNKHTFKFHIPVPLVALLATIMDFIYAGSKNTPALNKEKMAELTAINWACSIAGAKADLGYIPEYNLEKGIMQTIKWYKLNNWL